MSPSVLKEIKLVPSFGDCQFNFPSGAIELARMPHWLNGQLNPKCVLITKRLFRLSVVGRAKEAKKNLFKLSLLPSKKMTDEDKGAGVALMIPLAGEETSPKASVTVKLI